MLRLALALVCLTTAGCRVSLDEESTDPRSDEFYFPVGIALDPAPQETFPYQYLYVSNGNSDLKYGGGTLQAVDLQRFRCAYKRKTGQALNARSDETDCPDAGADEAFCAWDPSDPSVLNCAEEPFVLEHASVKVGNFAGGIRVQRTGPNRRRLFLAVRGDPSVTWVDVDYGKVGVGTQANRPGLLDCFDQPRPLPQDPPAPAPPGPAPVPPTCEPNHQVQRFACAGRPTCDQGFATIPTEPFNLQLDDGQLASGERYARLLVSHLASGQVMVIDVLAAPFVRDVSAPVFSPDANMRRGAFAMAVQRPGDPSSPWYVTSNLQATVAMFRVADLGVVVSAGAFSLSGPFAATNDLRDIAFERGGNRAFITVNTPPSVAVIDTRPQMVGPTPGSPSNQVVDVVNVCQTPSHMGLRYDAAGRPRIYVVCFQSNQVMVVDPDHAVVTDTIIVGRGPNDIAFDEARQVAYVTHYGESTVGVIDLLPGGASENRLIARIGVPVPPRTQ